MDRLLPTKIHWILNNGKPLLEMIKIHLVSHYGSSVNHPIMVHKMILMVLILMMVTQLNWKADIDITM